MLSRILSLVVITCLIYASIFCFECSSALGADRPNILIIFTDDQGYGDLGCFGNTKNKTPRLDQLAKQGTKFTSFYSQTVCGPSRSALLTGRYPIRIKGWGMPASEITFAELMRQAGYQTACIGKWDVSNRKPIVDLQKISPDAISDVLQNYQQVVSVLADTEYEWMLND